LAYPVVSRFAGQGIRRRVFRDYVIFYRAGSDVVHIIRILHGARDIELLLGFEK